MDVSAEDLTVVSSLAEEVLQILPADVVRKLELGQYTLSR